MPGESRGRIALIEAGSPGLNIYSHVAMGRGAALLATVVRDAGFDVRAFVEDVGGRDRIDWEYVRRAEVVGFSSITCTLPRTARLLERVRSVNPGAVIVLGGPEPTCEPSRSLALGADLVLRGEAELTLPRLLRSLTGGSDERLTEIPGIVWAEDGSMREGPPAVQLTASELAALPLVDRSLVHNSGGLSVAPVWRARGCPQRCDFCEVCEIWPRYVSRGDERSVEELVAAQDAGYSTAFLVDDNAAANKRSFAEFLRAAADRGYARMLVVQMRASAAFTDEGRLDREFLRLLRRVASVTVVCVGVESADDSNLERLHKRIDASRMARGLRAMKRYGLLVHGMFMALPEDTRAVIKRNGEFARRHVTSLQYLFETPLPGTKRTAEHERAGRILFRAAEDLALYDGMHVVLEPRHMNAPEMQALVLSEYRRFYSLRRIVASALHGAFARHRVLSDAQRLYLAGLQTPRRLRTWLRFHIEYKFAPVSFLAIGRRRVREFLRDPAYLAYLNRMRSSSAG